MKKLKLFLTLMLAMFVTTVGVKARTMDQLITDGVVTRAENESGNTYTLKLKEGATIEKDLEITAGQTVILDLNGQTLTNYCTTCSTIWIHAADAKLTIVDSVGNGTITTKSGSTGAAATISNEGTLVVEGGIITTTRNEEGAAAIFNQKTLTISGGEIQSTKGNAVALSNKVGATATITGTAKLTSNNASGNASTIFNEGALNVEGGSIEASRSQTSAIYNAATGELEITDGDIKTSGENVWGLSNVNSTADEVKISGGTFTQGSNYSVIVNTGKMTIEDGEFKATGDGHNSLISTTNAGETDVKGGKFTTETNGIFYEKTVGNGAEAGKTKISGGTYTINDEKADVTKYLAAENLGQSDSGVVGIIYKVEVKTVENGTIKAQYVNVTEGEDVTVNVTADKGYKLDKLTILDKDGKEVKFVSAEGGVKFTMPASNVTISATFKKSETPVVKPETTETTEEENPKTGDNILMYLGLGLASVAVATLSVKKLRKSN